jgi:hypothetical protein
MLNMPSLPYTARQAHILPGLSQQSLLSVEHMYNSDTLAEPEDYWLHVILIGAYLCDVALNDALCDNLRDFHVLVANRRQICFGGLCWSANGIACPLLLTSSV